MMVPVRDEHLELMAFRKFMSTGNLVDSLKCPTRCMTARVLDYGTNLYRRRPTVHVSYLGAHHDP